MHARRDRRTRCSGERAGDVARRREGYRSGGRPGGGRRGARHRDRRPRSRHVSEVVRAAGGVVLRDGRVLLVHRPRYGDWTFPKGKALPGESDEDCALREVEEETGLRCELGEELPATAYVDGMGRPKRVRWWRMRPVGGAFMPH